MAVAATITSSSPLLSDVVMVRAAWHLGIDEQNRLFRYKRLDILRFVEWNTAHLRTLEEIARRGSFSRAAEALHLSQPAVSLHIRQLEEQIGLPVLERVGKRAFPTSAGEIILDHASRAFRELEG